MTFTFQVILAFLALFITDICWAFYVSRVKDNNALKASLWAVLLFLTGAFAVISYTANPWLLIPAALGAFCGTFVAIKIEEKFKNGRSLETVPDWEE